MRKKVITMLLVVLSISLSCKEIKLPDWFYNVPQQDGFMYAIGISDECSSIAKAHSQADERGQALMSILYKSRVFGEVRNYEEYDSTFVNITLAYTNLDTKVTAELIAGISIETVKRFDYVKFVSISLCKMDLRNVNFIKDIKVFARVYKTERFNDHNTENYSHLELFAYNSLHPKKNGLFYLTKEAIEKALYKQFKASDAFKELEKDLGEETEESNLKSSNDEKNNITETKNKTENTPISMPEDEIIDEKIWLEFPISSISIKLENINNEVENTKKYIFHSRSKLNRKKNNDSYHKIEYPKWYNIQDDPEHISFYGIGVFDNPNSNLASIYLESVIDALSKNAEYLGTEVKGMEKDSSDWNIYNRSIKSSFDKILRMNMINLTDLGRQYSNNQNLYIQLISDKSRAEMQRIKEEEKLYEKFKKSKAFEK